MTLKNAMITAAAMGGFDTLPSGMFAKRPNTSLTRKARKERARELTRINMEKKGQTK